LAAVGSSFNVSKMALSRVIALVLACVLSTQAIKDSVTEIVSLDSVRARSAEAHRAIAAAYMAGQTAEVTAQDQQARSEAQREDRDNEGQVMEQQGCNCEWLHRQLEGMPLEANVPARYTSGISPLNFTESINNKSIGHKSRHDEQLHQQSALHDDSTAAKDEVRRKAEHLEANAAHRNQIYRQTTGQLVPGLTEQQERDDASVLADHQWNDAASSAAREKHANTEPYAQGPRNTTELGDAETIETLQHLGADMTRSIMAPINIIHRNNTVDGAAPVESTTEVARASDALEADAQNQVEVQKEQAQLNAELSKQQQNLTQTSQTVLFQRLEACGCAKEVERGNHPLG